MSSQGRFFTQLLRVARPLIKRFLSSQSGDQTSTRGPRPSSSPRPSRSHQQQSSKQPQSSQQPQRQSSSSRNASAHKAPVTAGAYPGDYTGRLTAVYDPHPDGNPDPGEVVWAWVPHEEDHSQGKDRPVLLAGWDGPWMLGFMLTSKDHDDRRDHAEFVDIGSGAWDKERRPSEARISRVIRINPDSVRRVGAILDKSRFDLVISEYNRHH